MKPVVSIVLPVYNYGNYIGAAIESIVNQSFKRWELVVINDGSTDNSRNIVESFSDSRIKLFNREHHGLVTASNFGMKRARGKYVVRMDADDIMAHLRLEEQVGYMEQNPEIGVLGTNVVKIDREENITGFIVYPERNEILRRILFRRNTLCHSSVLIREKVIREIGFYDERFRYAHDYELWLRIPKKYKFENLGKFLHAWRINPQGISKNKETRQLKFVIKAKIKAIKEGNLPLWSLVFIVKDLLVLVIPGFIKKFVRKNILYKIKHKRIIKSVDEEWKTKINQKLQL